MPLSLRLSRAVLRLVAAGVQICLHGVTDSKLVHRLEKKRKKKSLRRGKTKCRGRDVIYLPFITLTPGANAAPQHVAATHHVRPPPPAASVEGQHIKRIPRAKTNKSIMTSPRGRWTLNTYLKTFCSLMLRCDRPQTEERSCGKSGWRGEMFTRLWNVLWILRAYIWLTVDGERLGKGIGNLEGKLFGIGPIRFHSRASRRWAHKVMRQCLTPTIAQGNGKLTQEKPSVVMPFFTSKAFSFHLKMP